MRAIVYHGPGDKRWEQVPDPKLIDDTDAIVRVDTATICGTDLHILKGDVPAVTPGRILGHEAVGTVLETGPSVRSVREGDRVLLSCISACGHCRFCRTGQYGLILAVVAGGGAAVAAFATVSSPRAGRLASVVAGVALMDQIVGETVLLARPDQPSPIEVIYFAVGLLMVALGLLALTVGRS